jgi:hypothetical protein
MTLELIMKDRNVLWGWVERINREDEGEGI